MKQKKFLTAITVLLFGGFACMTVERFVSGPEVAPLLPTVASTPYSCKGGECLDICLDNLENALETRPFEPLTNEIYVEYEANINLVIYKVDGDNLVESTNLWVPPDYVIYQEDIAAHQRIWDFYTSIIPAEQRSMVKEFVIFTDGPGGNIGAWVTKFVNKPDDWKVGFDLLDSDYPLYLADALIHETGHLVTLNTSQIPYDENMTFTGKQNHPNCTNYVTSDGCSLPDSYINLFYQRFWKDLYEEWWDVEQQAHTSGTYEEYQSILEPFYQNHQDEFVTRYVATNIDEDLAESWSVSFSRLGLRVMILHLKRCCSLTNSRSLWN